MTSKWVFLLTLRIQLATPFFAEQVALMKHSEKNFRTKNEVTKPEFKGTTKPKTLKNNQLMKYTNLNR